MINWQTLQNSTLISFSLHVFTLSRLKIILNYQFQKPVISQTIRHAVPHTMHVPPIHTFLPIIFGTSLGGSSSEQGRPLNSLHYMIRKCCPYLTQLVQVRTEMCVHIQSFPFYGMWACWCVDLNLRLADELNSYTKQSGNTWAFCSIAVL